MCHLSEDWETAVENTEAPNHSYFCLIEWVVGYPTHDYLLLEKVAKMRDAFRRVPSAVKRGFSHPTDLVEASLTPDSRRGGATLANQTAS